MLHYLFRFKLTFRSRLLCGVVAILLRKPWRKVRQWSIIEWFGRDVPAMDEVGFRRNFRLSCAAGHFPATAARVSRPWSLGYNWKQSMRSTLPRPQHSALASAKLQQAKSQTTFECIYKNTFTSKVSLGLDKPSPKLLGQDEPRFELATGWISRERRFFTIYTGGSHLI